MTTATIARLSAAALDVAAPLQRRRVRAAHLDPRIAAGELERPHSSVCDLPGAVGLLAGDDHGDLRRLCRRGARVAVDFRLAVRPRRPPSDVARRARRSGRGDGPVRDRIRAPRAARGAGRPGSRHRRGRGRGRSRARRPARGPRAGRQRRRRDGRHGDRRARIRAARPAAPRPDRARLFRADGHLPDSGRGRRGDPRDVAARARRPPCPAAHARTSPPGPPRPRDRRAVTRRGLGAGRFLRLARSVAGRPRRALALDDPRRRLAVRPGRKRLAHRSRLPPPGPAELRPGRHGAGDHRRPDRALVGLGRQHRRVLRRDRARRSGLRRRLPGRAAHDRVAGRSQRSAPVSSPSLT